MKNTTNPLNSIIKAVFDYDSSSTIGILFKTWYTFAEVLSINHCPIERLGALCCFERHVADMALELAGQQVGHAILARAVSAWKALELVEWDLVVHADWAVLDTRTTVACVVDWIRSWIRRRDRCRRGDRVKRGIVSDSVCLELVDHVCQVCWVRIAETVKRTSM